MHLPVFSSERELFKPVARDYPDGYALSDHWHDAAQLIYALDGVMELKCGDACWIISPQQALWMPARLPHALRARGAVTLRSVYVAPRLCAQRLPDAPRSLAVPPLLRELIRQARAVTDDTPASSYDAHLMQLLLDEIERARVMPLDIPLPDDNRLRNVCLRLLDDPGDDRGLDAWGALVGASARTLSRLFRAELGTSFLLWRQQVRVAAAIPRLADGEPVTRIAADLGYDSPGAFIAVFRRLTGHTPRAFAMQAG